MAITESGGYISLPHQGTASDNTLCNLISPAINPGTHNRAMNTQSLQSSLSRLCNNKTFEWSVIAIIVLSALLVGAKTYDFPPRVLQAIQVLDWLITAVFLTEILIRFTAEPNKRRFFHKGWNVFDTLVVVVSLIPVENSDVAILGRMVRIFRVLRMISIVPELRVLLNSLIKALPQLGYVVLLMFVIFYVYAAIGSTLFASINPILWGDIGISLLTLFRIMTFEDWTDVMYETMDVYTLSWTFYLSFIFFTAFAFLNMMIGIIVNVMNQEHVQEQSLMDHSSALNQQLQAMHQELQEMKQLLATQTQPHRKSSASEAAPIT